MTTAQHTALEMLARSSRRTAAVTALSALMVLGSLGYSWYQLKALDHQLKALDHTLKERRIQLEAATSEWERLRRETEELRALAPASAPLRQVCSAQLSTHIIPGGHTDSGKQLYDFVLSLSVPEVRRKEIDHVEYIINHPETLEKVRVGRSPVNGFATSYRGYGCFNPVIVKVVPRFEPAFEIPFDMCDAWRTELASTTTD